MSTLERAIEIAVAAHKGQRDKGGAPYVLHPLRMMFKLEHNEERMAALLHDVVEDCGWTFERLAAEGFSETVVKAFAASPSGMANRTRSSSNARVRIRSLGA